MCMTIFCLLSKKTWENWNGYDDKQERTMEEIVHIMKDDYLNSHNIKDELSRVIQLRSESIQKMGNKPTEYLDEDFQVKHWNEQHVNKFILNFKKEIPQ